MIVEFEAKQKRVEALENGNQRSYEEIREATHGRFAMDTSDLRRELLIAHLVRWGLITEEQHLDYEIEFHEQVEAALNRAWEQLRENEKKAKLSVVKNPTKLLDKNGRPL